MSGKAVVISQQPAIATRLAESTMPRKLLLCNALLPNFQKKIVSGYHRNNVREDPISDSASSLVFVTHEGEISCLRAFSNLLLVFVSYTVHQ